MPNRRGPSGRAGVPLAVFLLLTFGLSWGIEFAVLSIPGAALGTPVGGAVLAIVMLMPGLASFVTVRVLGGGDWATTVGLRGRRTGSTVVRLSLVGTSTAIFVTLAATALAHVLGWFRLDLAELSGAHFIMAHAPVPITDMSADRFVLLSLGQVLLASLTVNAALALGEETGWRGWLMPHLLRWGRSRAIVISGLVWGAWHAPLILHGYEYGAQTSPVLGIGLFILYCTALGTFLAWLRLRSTSVIPCALTHGTVNACAGIPVLLGSTQQDVNDLIAPMVGLPVVIVWAVVGAGVMLVRRRPAPSRGPRRDHVGREPADAGGSGGERRGPSAA